MQRRARQLKHGKNENLIGLKSRPASVTKKPAAIEYLSDHAMLQSRSSRPITVDGAYVARRTLNEEKSSVCLRGMLSVVSSYAIQTN